MTKSKILQRDAAILRKIAKPVPVEEIGSKKIQAILSKMKKALHAEEDGVAIAAPQIGESLRIFVVSGEVLALDKKRKKSQTLEEDLVFINPEIIKTSKKRKKMEEGCLSVRWLYGQVARSEKVTLKAYDENGLYIERGASGLLAQIFQHETDHLDGVLFIDKAENIRDMPPSPRLVYPARSGRGEAGQENIKYAFFGSSQFSRYVLNELELAGFSPELIVSSAKDPLPMAELKKLNADVFVVASFGKILPKELIEMPKHKTLNVHPSLLPQLRGASPIQNTILGLGEPGRRHAEASSGLAKAGVTIIKMDEKMDHGPILIQSKVDIAPWPDHYHVVEEKLGQAGGQLLAAILPKWVEGKLRELPQDHESATFTKLIKKEDGLLDLNDPAEKNLRKVLAYSTWPGAYMFYSAKAGGSASPGGGKKREIRLIIKDAKVVDGQFVPTRVIPAGKREMNWQDFLRGN
ncbi:MAG: peptide deformylase [bacterium]|nr:peptide deformylase [bacterium]